MYILYYKIFAFIDCNVDNAHAMTIITSSLPRSIRIIRVLFDNIGNPLKFPVKPPTAVPNAGPTLAIADIDAVVEVVISDPSIHNNMEEMRVNIM